MKNEYLEQTKQFYAKYQKEGYPVIKKYESLQKRLLLKVICYYSLLLVIEVVLLFFAIIQTERTGNVLYFYLLALCCYGVFKFFQNLVYKENWKYNNKLKTECMDKFLEIFGNIGWKNTGEETSISGSNFLLNNFKLSPSAVSEPFTDLEIFSYGLFPPYTHRRDDDFFFGTYKDVSFKIVETTLYYKIKTSKKRDKTSFRGVLVLFHTAKKTKSPVVIKQRSSFKKKLQLFWNLLVMVYIILSGAYIVFFNPVLLNVLILFFAIPALLIGIAVYINNLKFSNDVKLESADFNKKFSITTGDQVEARYLITPAFMERLLKLKTAFNADTVSCSFQENRVMFALGTSKNLFELGSLFRKADDPKSIKDFYNEFSSIIRMIEYFKLDEKTGL